MHHWLGSSLSCCKKPIKRCLIGSQDTLHVLHLAVVRNELYIAVGVWNIVKLGESDEDLGRHIHNDDKDVFRKMIRVCEPDADTQKACVLLEEMIDHQV
ncbi:BnaCnng19960D [Brassica napus]|uniref:BnaCnng19960D protein n=1 Tax=Brassica napus TaxID=3708 RepID=A0A078INA6_BRANA|nr:BnaCnng19960D [Brassica napus]